MRRQSCPRVIREDESAPTESRRRPCRQRRPPYHRNRRLRTEERTKAYVARRLAEGHSKLEAIRCLKRYIAREVFGLIRRRLHEINQTQFAA